MSPQNYYTVYLAGPISGLDYVNGQDWRKTVIDSLPENIEGISPLRNKSYLASVGIIEGSYDVGPLSTQRGIYARDRFDCHRSDIVMVNFLNSPVDIDGKPIVSMGTIMEIAWAAQNNTPVVLMMDEKNIHNHPMVLEACPFIVKTLDAGIALITDLLSDSRGSPPIKH